MADEAPEVLPHTPRELVRAHAQEALGMKSVEWAQVHATLADAWATADLADATRGAPKAAPAAAPKSRDADVCLCSHTKDQHYQAVDFNVCRMTGCGCTDFTTS